MSRRGVFCLPALALAAVLVSAGRGGAEEVDSGAGAKQGVLARSVAGRLTLGVRFNHTWLVEDRRAGPNGYDNRNKKGNFLGSLWGLDAQPQYVPLPLVEYRVVRTFGAGVAYDQVRIKTLDWANPERTVTAGDGDLEIRGVQAFAFGRWANRTRATPYLQVGFAHYWSRFLESPGWAAPGRYFEVESTQGWILTAGVRFAVGKGVALDGSYQRRELGDVQAAAVFANGGRINGVFPVRSNVMAVGVVYEF
jgi:opacity protein-like surface antigen